MIGDGRIIQPEITLSPDGHQTVADEIRAIARGLAQPSLRGRIPEEADLQPNQQLLAQYFAERYGVLGHENSTLQSIGDRRGLTRERIRQVQSKMLERSARIANVSTPRLADLEACIEQSVPIPISVFDQKHRALLGESLSVLDAVRFAAEVLGRKIGNIVRPPIGPVGNDIEIMLADGDGLSPLRAIRSVARRMINTCGAAHLDTVAGGASELCGAGVSIRDARKALRAMREFEWLNEATGWFWLGPEVRNRALKTARKALAVASGRLDIEELHAALCRSRRLSYEEDRESGYALEPPWQVLREMLCRVPWLRTVQDNDFELIEKVEPGEVLSESEQLVYEVALEHEGIFPRSAMNERLVKTGLFSSMNLHFILTTSPIIRKIERGVWGLIGTPISIQALEAARKMVGGEQRQGQLTEIEPDES